MRGGQRLSFVGANESPMKGTRQIASESGATGNMGIVEEVDDENYNDYADV